MKSASGIYQIRNTLNGKVYVGSARRLDKRRECHLGALRRNQHDNKHLQRAWNRYGEDNFSFEVLEDCAIEILFEREQHWIDSKESSKPQKGYNKAKKAGCPMAGNTHTKRARAKIAKASREHWSDPTYRETVLDSQINLVRPRNQKETVPSDQSGYGQAEAG